MNVIYITICILILLPVEVEALKCHECTGTGNCGDPFKSNFLQDCLSTVNKFCMKEKSGSSVSRTCQAVCVEGETSTGITTCCDTDGCNSGTNLGSSLLLLLLLPLTSIFVGKHVF